jgi:hypothetical protein
LIPTQGPVADGDPRVAKVMQAFVRDGRLIQIPARRAKRLIVLDLMAQDFEPGRRFTEAEVDERLQRWHADYCALRRYLVDEDFLDRAHGQYWRCGGELDIDGAGRRWATPSA